MPQEVRPFVLFVGWIRIGLGLDLINSEEDPHLGTLANPTTIQPKYNPNPIQPCVTDTSSQL